MPLVINLSDEEFQLAKEFSNFHNITIDEAFKKVFFEKLEDEYDLKVADKAYDEYIKSDKQTRPVQELWDELGIWYIILKLKNK